jgi:hypothetical protein
MATARPDTLPDFAEIVRAAAKGAAEGGDYRDRLTRLEVESANREKSHNLHVAATEGVLRDMRGDIKAGADAQAQFAKQFAEFAARSNTLFGFGGKLGQGVFGIICAAGGAVLIKALTG